MGVGGTTNSFEAPAVPNSHNVKVIAANGDNSLALTADGAVCAWGRPHPARHRVHAEQVCTAALNTGPMAPSACMPSSSVMTTFRSGTRHSLRGSDLLAVLRRVGRARALTRHYLRDAPSHPTYRLDRPNRLGLERVKARSPGGVVRDIECVLTPVLVPEPYDDATRSPKLSDIGFNEPGGLKTDVEAEIPAVIRPGRIEKSTDSDAEAHCKAEQLVDDDIALPQLRGADGGPPPGMAKFGHTKREVILCHVLEDAVRPDVRRQGD